MTLSGLILSQVSGTSQRSPLYNDHGQFRGRHFHHASLVRTVRFGNLFQLLASGFKPVCPTPGHMLVLVSNVALTQDPGATGFLYFG